MDVEFTSSVGDTTHAIYNQYGARQMELVALNTIFCAVPSEPLTSTLKKGGGTVEVGWESLKRNCCIRPYLLIHDTCDL